jgi:hypothetical protein
METKLKPSKEQFYKYINDVLSEDDAHDFYNKFELSNEIYEENSKYGLCNCIGEILVLPLFDDFMLLSSKPLAPGNKVVAKQNGLWGIVQLDGELGEWVVAPEYDYISYPNRIAGCLKDGKWGYLDTLENKFIIPLSCDRISLEGGFVFCNGIGTFEINGRWGVIRTDGEYTEAIFDEVEEEFDQAVKVRIGDVWGYVNEDGQFIEDADEAYYVREV